MNWFCDWFMTAMKYNNTKGVDLVFVDEKFIIDTISNKYTQHLSLTDDPFQRHTPNSGEKMGVAGTLSDNCPVIYIAQFLPSIALFA